MKLTLSLICIIICFCPGEIFTQNAPITTAGTGSTYGSAITIPVSASNFSGIGSCNLKLSYNPAIAAAVSVTTSADLGGTVSANLGVPGEIYLGWFTSPAMTLPDNSAIFYFDFVKVSSGTSILAWFDDGPSCQYTDGSFNTLNDIPASAYYISGSLSFLLNDAPLTTANAITACPGTIVNIPVTVSAFNNIGAFNLKMQYNPANLSFQSSTGNAGIPGLKVDGSKPGTIVAGATVFNGGTPVTLADNSVLFTLTFFYSGNTAFLNWVDDGPSCQFTGPPPAYPVLNDAPQGSYYFNGTVNSLSLPAAPVITLQPVSPPPVYPGKGTAAFKVRATGSDLTYQWQEFVTAWSDIANGGIYAGTLTDSLTLTGPPAAMNGYKYRCTVSGSCDPPATTDGNATLIIDASYGISDPLADHGSVGQGSSGNPLRLNVYPNPFSGQVAFSFDLPDPGSATLEILNILGETIEVVTNRNFRAGEHSLNAWPNLAGHGIYLAVLTLNTRGNLTISKIKIIHM